MSVCVTKIQKNFEYIVIIGLTGFRQTLRTHNSRVERKTVVTQTYI